MKKTINIAVTLTIGTLVTTGIVAPSFAADTKEATSNATIKAIAGGDTPVAPVEPTDPKDPSKPGPTDPNDGNTTNQTGPLQINYLSHLNFGDEIAITPQEVTANEKSDTPRFFQVSDLRGTGAGWKLNVSLGDFKPTDSSSKVGSIDGATITFKKGEADTSNQSNDDTAKVSDVKLTAGDKSVQTLLSADTGTGRGTWLARYTAESDATDNEKVVFNAPTEKISADTNYQAILTWQLVDTPNK